MNEQPQWDRGAVDAALAEHKDKPGALLPVLHGVQDRIGYIPADAVPVIARALNLSRAEVHGVITFYHHFRQEQPGRYTVSVCQAEACQSMGSRALTEHVKARLGIDLHETTADGKYTLEPVYCLGNCACAPALMVGESDLHGRVTAARFDQLLKDMEGEAV